MQRMRLLVREPTASFCIVIYVNAKCQIKYRRDLSLTCGKKSAVPSLIGLGGRWNRNRQNRSHRQCQGDWRGELGDEQKILTCTLDNHARSYKYIQHVQRIYMLQL